MNINKIFLLVMLASFLMADDSFDADFNYFGNLSASKLTSAGFNLNEYKHDSVGNEIDLAPYSKVGAQVIYYNDDWTFTAQGLLRKKDSSFEGELTWLNVKYAINDNFALRVGKIQTKVLLNSESLDIDYLHLWAKPPSEVYRLMPIRTFNGVELTYTDNFSDYNFHVSIVGLASNKTTINLKKDTEAKLKVDGSHSITFTLANDYITYKASLSRSNMNIEDDVVTAAIVNQLKALGNDMSRFTYEDRFISVGSLGFKYYNNGFSLDTEIARSESNSLLPSSTGAYVMLGYKMCRFTPFVMYAENRNDKSYFDTSNIVGSAVLKENLDNMLYLHNFSQKTVSLGMRYNIDIGMSFKAQVDRISTSNYGSISSSGIQNTGYERVGILSRDAGVDDKAVYALILSFNFAY